MSMGWEREHAGRKPDAKLTQEEIEALIKEQDGLCAAGLRAGQRRRSLKACK
jgi:hypothetical protein